MTTHRAHANLFHNQCLALQAIAILLKRNAWNRRAAWIYEHAARGLLPDIFPEEEPPMPTDVPVYLPKVMLCDGVESSEDVTLVNRSERRNVETLKGIGS